MTRPSFIGHYTDFCDDDNAHYPDSSELLSIGSAVGHKLGLVKIGIHIETLLPGRRTSWPHAESDEEEFGFVIEGSPHVWIDGELHELKAGDFVAFPSGTGIAHTFINNSNEPVRLLVGGEKKKSTNKIFYSFHEERNLFMKTKETYWENHPVLPLGPHNGEPDKPNKLKYNLPQFETERLILRTLEVSDAPSMFKYASLKPTTEFVSWDPHKTIEESAKLIATLQLNYLRGVPEPYGICLKSNPQEIIGTAGLFWVRQPHKIMEIGAVIGPNHWGKGITLEAFKPLISYAWKNLEVERIQGRCMQGHVKSRRLMEKLGMTYEGLIRSSFPSRGEMKDMEMFSLLKKEWPL